MAGNAEDGDLTLSRKIFFTTLVAQVFFFFLKVCARPIVQPCLPVSHFLSLHIYHLHGFQSLVTLDRLMFLFFSHELENKRNARKTKTKKKHVKK